MLDQPSILLLYATNAGFAFSAAAVLWVMRAKIQKHLSSVIAPKREQNAADTDLFTIGFCAALLTLCLLGIIGVNPWMAMLGSVITGMVTPRQLRARRIEKWQRSFDTSLVESLTTISSSLRAGLTLKDSLDVAARNCAPAFAHEASAALKEYHFGMPLDEALDNIRKRVKTQNANITFGAMILGTQLGGNLPATLQRIVRTVRERERVEGKLKALTAQGRTQAMLLCSAPPAIGVCMYLWDPSKMSLLTDTFQGQVLLCLAIVLEVIGIAVTRKIMKLEV